MIDRKVRGVILRGNVNVAERWMGRGARTGFCIALVLLPILIALFVILRHLSILRWQREDDFFLDIFALVLGGLMTLPMIFAVIFLIFGSLIKPIWVALFCNVERFEQEYGSTKQ
jgi:spore maturation protein SpmB